MKVVLFAAVVLTGLMLQGCSQHEYKPIKSSASRSCAEPESPFASGSEKDRGFQWAKKRQLACTTGSDSFKAGCEEFHVENEKYKRCS